MGSDGGKGFPKRVGGGWRRYFRLILCGWDVGFVKGRGVRFLLWDEPGVLKFLGWEMRGFDLLFRGGGRISRTGLGDGGRITFD